MRAAVLLLAALATIGAGRDAAADGAVLPYGKALFQGLDKVTARITEFTAPVGQPTRFGSLDIVVHACRKTPPTEPPESAAAVTIDEVEGDGAHKTVFSGWMFASSPGLSALEHPVYDVWVVGCEDPLPEPSSPLPSPAAPAQSG